MKLITRPGVVYLLLTLPALFAVSCSSNTSQEQGFWAKKMGQTETIKNEVTPSASINETILTESTPTGQAPMTTETITSSNSYQSSSNPSSFNGQATNSTLNLGNYSQGYHGPFPYYCDPTRYPAHIINAIAACKPFLGQINSGTIPWTDLFGSRHRYRDRLGDHYPNYSSYGNCDSDDDYDNFSDYNNDDDDDRDCRDGKERRVGREERAWLRVHRNDR